MLCLPASCEAGRTRAADCERALVAAIGKPRTVASDDEEHILFYAFGEAETEFKFTLDSHLKWLTLHLHGPEPKTVWMDKP